MPGDAIDGGVASFELDARPLSAAMEDVDFGVKTTREMIHFMGSKEPGERTGGYREYTGSGTLPLRQLLLLAKEVATNDGNEDDPCAAICDHEFTLSIACTPAGDPNTYTFYLERLTFDDLPFKIDTKSKSDVKVSFSFMKLRFQVTQ